MSNKNHQVQSAQQTVNKNYYNCRNFKNIGRKKETIPDQTMEPKPLQTLTKLSETDYCALIKKSGQVGPVPKARERPPHAASCSASPPFPHILSEEAREKEEIVDE